MMRHQAKMLRAVKQFQNVMMDGTKEFMALDNSGDAIDEIVEAAEKIMKKRKFDQKYLLAALLASSAKSGQLLEEVKE